MQTSTSKPVLFWTSAYEPLATDMAGLGAFEMGIIGRKTFPDGERWHRIVSDVVDRDCVLVGGTGSDADTLSVFDIGCGLASAGARTLSLVVPYFGHGTSDREVEPGEVVTAKTRAILLSSIGRAAAGNRVYLLDAHAEGLPYYFESHLRPFHLYAQSVLLPVIKELGGDSFVLATVDSGRAKWVAHFADILGVDTAVALKRRLDGSHTELVAVAASVRGRRVGIYDDMIRTGESLINAAKVYAKGGATSIFAVVTHAVFAGNALADLSNSGLFEQIVVTDSHPRAREIESDFVRVVSCAPVLVAPFA
jgi:ribose-phosphate pyrophosphokinase